MVMLCYGVYMLIWALALIYYAESASFFVAVLIGVGQVLWHFSLIRTRSREGCFKAFRLNHWLGFTVFAGVVASFWQA
jgi:4-hydroxybenzoate polyprenyltransferase